MLRDPGTRPALDALSLPRRLVTGSSFVDQAPSDRGTMQSLRGSRQRKRRDGSLRWFRRPELVGTRRARLAPQTGPPSLARRGRARRGASGRPAKRMSRIGPTLEQQLIRTEILERPRSRSQSRRRSIPLKINRLVLQLIAPAAPYNQQTARRRHRVGTSRKDFHAAKTAEGPVRTGPTVNTRYEQRTLAARAINNPVFCSELAPGLLASRMERRKIQKALFFRSRRACFQDPDRAGRQCEKHGYAIIEEDPAATAREPSRGTLYAVAGRPARGVIAGVVRDQDQRSTMRGGATMGQAPFGRDVTRPRRARMEAALGIARAEELIPKARLA